MENTDSSLNDALPTKELRGPPDVKEKISILEARGRKLCVDLEALRTSRAELLRETEVLSRRMEEAHCIRRTEREHSDSEESYFRGHDRLEHSTDANSYASPLHFGICSSLCSDHQCPQRRSREDHGCPCDGGRRSRRRKNRRVDLKSYDFGVQPCQSCEIVRYRGGVDLPAECQERSDSTGCTCPCTICALRNSSIESPPCHYRRTKVDHPPSYNVFDEDVESIAERAHDRNTPPEIDKICRVEKLREGLERLKNRNHTLKKLLRNCDYPSLEDPSNSGDNFRDGIQETHGTCGCDYESGTNAGESENPGETTSGLIAVVKILQKKCRTKDGMIVALADEVRRRGTVEQTGRILRELADPDLSRRACDFDRSTLWRYLNALPSEFPAGKTDRASGDGCTAKDLSFGLLPLVLLILPTLFRLYACFAPKVEFTYSTLISCASKVFLPLLKLLPGRRCLEEMHCCTCNGIIAIVSSTYQFLSNVVTLAYVRVCALF